MVVEVALGRERVVDPVADGVAQLGLGHAAVQGQGGDEVHVVHAGGGGDVEHGLDDPLAHVGPPHRREGQADVVEADGELHARVQQRSQRRAVAEGLSQRTTDLGVGVLEGFERLAGVEDSAATGGETLQAQALAVVEQDGRGRAVDLEDEARAGHQRLSLSRSARRSKAILTAPRRPAVAAWSMASS